MLNVKMGKRLQVALAACIATCALNGSVFADSTQDSQAQALQDQMRVMQQQMQELQQKIDSLTRQEQATANTAAAAAAAAAAGPPASAATVPEEKEPLLHKVMSGFFGTLDVSVDQVTKGITGPAYPWTCTSPLTNSGCSIAGPAKIGAAGGTGPVGPVGSMFEVGTNKSVLGYRGSHQIGDTQVKFIYQIETQPSLTAAPGLNTSYTQQSDITKAGIGYGDTWLGIAPNDPTNDWGTAKIGVGYAPYKTSTDRFNPFSGMLGDYAVIMGNTGGDNRVEFGTRLEHSIWYDSPKFFDHTFSFDVLFSPGQNRTYDNVVQSAGSPDCNGGNVAGSGNLPENCDDGAFGTAWSADLKFEYGGFYATVAYELHKDVNRNSDGVGSNDPTYGYLMGLGNGVSPLLDWADYNSYVAEYGQNYINVNGFTPEFATDVYDEKAYKTGVMYTWDFGLSIGTIYEYLKRDVPPDMEWQNERTRDSWWFVITQDIGAADSISLGHAHAGATPGDPAGQHNYDPAAGPDYADMYTAAWKHHFDKHFYAYLDWADTINHGNSHFDLGAGGRSLTTDCHDGTNATVNDYSSAGPTTWGGDQCHPEGVSAGMNYKF